MSLKVCWKCGDEHELEAGFYKNRSNPDGHNRECKTCQKGYRKARANDPKSRPTVLRALRNANCQRLYGISLEEKERIFELQGKVCASCGSENARGQWCLDHNHETNEIRGVVCRPCNLILGLAHESIEHLKKVQDYLRKSQKVEGVGA